MGAVDILIVWENLEIHRIVLKNHQTDGKLIYCFWIISFSPYSIMLGSQCESKTN